jgi:prolyl-tRNA synthetase
MVDSYRDLPLLLNQWANVVRWEMRPRTFLRTTEFLWQEGHTAHATESDARQYARRILHDVYADFMREVLAMPVIVGRKTASERFAGAANTMTCEAVMRDGKALQMGTSHELGQRFSRAFDIGYLSAEGSRELCWTTSWGSSTRMLGGLIMCHGDDFGLVLPPKLAPIQAVVVVVKDTGGDVISAAAALVDKLERHGIRVRLDDDVDQAFGWRATDWELQGVPVRVEIGPRDLAGSTALLYRRDTRDKTTVALEAVADDVQQVLLRMQTDMLEAATARRDAFISDSTTVDEVHHAAQTGVARVPWASLGVPGEHRLAADGLTVRCLQRENGALPDTDDDAGAIAYVARAY